MAKKTPNVSAFQASAVLGRHKSLARAKVNAWFFKTGPGEYGHGDIFWGVTMFQTRAVAKKFQSLSLSEVLKLLKHKVHEARVLGAVILVNKFQRATAPERKKIYRAYIKNARYFNNWDLVDISAPNIVGAYSLEHENWIVLKKLARSKNLWERRIAILATFYFTRQKNCTPALTIARLLLGDKHDLMHKAVGWMLREVGKNCGEPILKKFLRANYNQLSRTTLRYAIERFSKRERQLWLVGNI